MGKFRKKRITQKALQEFIQVVAWQKPSSIPGDNGEHYHSRVDGSYLGRVGMERDCFGFLLKRGITEQLQNDENKAECTANIGFNPKEQKWHGWSYRAIYGFGIGAVCKKGDCGYVPDTVDELFDSVTVPDKDGWAWQKPEDVGRISNGIQIKHEMTTLGPKRITDACDVIVDKEDFLSGDIKQTKESGGCALPIEPKYQIIECGRGEWTAQTLEDAKQMAIDFARGVS